MSTFTPGQRVTTRHLGDRIYGTVVGIQERGIFSVDLVQVDWDGVGPNWELSKGLEVVEP